jgi:hypothetical protein
LEEEKMKTFLTLSIALLFATCASAGIAGLLTSETRSWQFVQQTGGMRIGAPIEKDGKKRLPIDYDVSGLTTITCKPTTMNSGLAVRRIEAVGKDGKIVIRVTTQVIEKKSTTGSKHFADLSGFPRGSYDVYYEIAGDPEKFLGRIEIK